MVGGKRRMMAGGSGEMVSTWMVTLKEPGECT